MKKLKKKIQQHDLDVTAIVVDDDKGVLFLHELMIRESNFARQIYSFKCAEDALHYIETDMKSDLPALIFLDINMPRMNGWEFIHHLEASGPGEEIYIIMVTSSINKADREKAEQFDRVVHFVEKPLSIEICMRLKSMEVISHLFSS